LKKKENKQEEENEMDYDSNDQDMNAEDFVMMRCKFAGESGDEEKKSGTNSLSDD